jgi:hypothetical protein
MVSSNLTKIKVTSTADGSWTAIEGTNGKGIVDIVSIQWSETDGSNTLEIQEAVGNIGGSGNTYTTTRDSTTGNIITHTSTTTKDIEVFNPPRPACMPLYYKDNGGGSNTFIIKYDVRKN